MADLDELSVSWGVPSTRKPPPLSGYLYERACFLSFFAPLVLMTHESPNYMGALTSCMLGLHCVYFSVDKASPHAHAAVQLLHCTSFAGAMCILFGYACLSLGGTYRYGNWLAWENAIGEAPHGISTLVLSKAYMVVWPALAHLFDSCANRVALQRAYAKTTRPFGTMAFGICAYVALAVASWQAYIGENDEAFSILTTYKQPEAFSSKSILGYIFDGVEAGSGPPATIDASALGIADDTIFAVGLGCVTISFAVMMMYAYVRPLMPDVGSRVDAFSALHMA